MANSPSATTRLKPKKPHPDFPLFPHQNGQWAKKVKGKLHYFGAWEDLQSALQRWLSDRDSIIAGHERPSQNPDGLLMHELVKQFLSFKQSQQFSNELSARSFRDLHREGARIIQFSVEIDWSTTCSQMTLQSSARIWPMVAARRRLQIF